MALVILQTLLSALILFTPLTTASALGGCNADLCYRAVVASASKSARSSDCASFMQTTVTICPATTSTTVISTLTVSPTTSTVFVTSTAAISVLTSTVSPTATVISTVTSFITTVTFPEIGPMTYVTSTSYATYLDIIDVTAATLTLFDEATETDTPSTTTTAYVETTLFVPVTQTTTVTIATTSYYNEKRQLAPVERLAYQDAGLMKRATVACGTSTASPTAVPKYASACSGTSRYSSACSCDGVPATTHTTQLTVTSTITQVISMTPTATSTSTITLLSTSTSYVTPDAVSATTETDTSVSVTLVTGTYTVPAYASTTLTTTLFFTDYEHVPTTTTITSPIVSTTTYYDVQIASSTTVETLFATTTQQAFCETFYARVSGGQYNGQYLQYESIFSPMVIAPGKSPNGLLRYSTTDLTVQVLDYASVSGDEGPAFLAVRQQDANKDNDFVWALGPPGLLCDFKATLAGSLYTVYQPEGSLQCWDTFGSMYFYVCPAYASEAPYGYLGGALLLSTVSDAISLGEQLNDIYCTLLNLVAEPAC